MENSSDKQLLWDRQQQADQVRKDREYRDWLKNFALVAALIALALVVARLLAGVAVDRISVL